MSRKTKFHVWVLHEHGDDYHGSRVAGVFKRLRNLTKVRKVLEDSPACPDTPECTFEYWYHQELMELQ